MDSKRIFLYAALIILGFALWRAWQTDYPPQHTPLTSPTASSQAASDDVTTQGASVTSKTASGDTDGAKAALTQSDKAGELIQVHTDVLNIAIDTRGGRIVEASLPKYPQALDTPNKPYVLFNQDPNNLYLAKSALVSQQGPDSPNNGQALFKAEKTSYHMSPDEKQLVVNLHWQGQDGLDVVKSYTFERGSYDIKVDYKVTNNSSKVWQGHTVNAITRVNNPPTVPGMFQVHAYFGASISTADKPYEKIKFKAMDEKNLSVNSQGGWAAMQEHYFLSAWAPNQDQENHFFSHAKEYKDPNGNTDPSKNLYTIGVAGPQLTIQPGATLTTGSQLYVGPEIAEYLNAVAPNLKLTIDYGWLWFISQIIFWLMQKIYLVVGNWGWSIVLVTVLIKGLFYKLSAKSYKSMANMRNLTPKIQALKERFGDDREKLSRATMELYKKEKVNPLGGCLPILVQIPVFIALYWVLIESVQLRQAPFILWIHDLSVKDPYYILPILFGLTMLVQQKLNPPPPDPTQAKLMMFLPVMMTFIFLNFPAGLVLYMFVNSAMSVLQQWLIMRSHGKTVAKKCRAS